MLLKNKFFKLAVFFLMTCFIFVKPLFAKDMLIAIVNDELITQSDLKEYIQATYAGVLSHGGYSQEDLEKIQLDLEINGIQNLIEDKLILSKAKEKDLQINERLIDERIDGIKARYPDEQTFLAALLDKGVSISDIRTKINDQLMIKFIVTNEVRSKIFVNPQEVTKFYDRNLDDFKKKDRIILESIFISSENDKEASLKEAGLALDKLKSGEDFNAVKLEYSDAASIGTVERGQLMDKIEDIIFELEPDEISDAIDVDTGIYIFKLKEEIPAETTPLDEVKDKIYNMLFSQKFEKLFGEWIAELKENAYIEIKD